MSPAEILHIPDTEEGRQKLRELAAKHLSGPGPWKHNWTYMAPGHRACHRCHAPQEAPPSESCTVCPPATGSLADIAKGLKDEVKKRNAHQALWNVIDECKYADDGDGLAWLYWHSTLHEEVAALLLALEGE